MTKAACSFLCVYFFTRGSHDARCVHAVLSSSKRQGGSTLGLSVVFPSGELRTNRTFVFFFFLSKGGRETPLALLRFTFSVHHRKHGHTNSTGRREYQCRKNRNEGKGDAVYSNLAYIPVCNCMPVCKKGCRNPFFMWTKKGTH